MATETTRAIVPEDDSWRYHKRPDHPFWNESGLFGFMIPERKIDGYFYVWHRPNMNLTSAGVAIWDDKGCETHNCLYSEWFHFNPLSETTDMFDFELANGMRCQLLEPLKRYRLGYDSDEFALDLLWEGAYHPPNLHYDNSEAEGFEVWGGVHYEQLGAVKGTVTLDGKTLKVDCHAFRDHSRGLRPGPLRGLSGGGFDYGWASERTSFAVTSARGVPTAPVSARSIDQAGYGHLIKDGQMGRIVSGEREVTEREQDGRPRHVRLRLTDEHGRELRADAEVQNCLKWHSIWHMQWCLAKWTIDGEEGWGECQDWFDIAVMRAHQRQALG
ncbi:MAG: DUF7065 domain-containing protein [Solirubrobacteraceae bacterium]